MDPERENGRAPDENYNGRPIPKRWGGAPEENVVSVWYGSGNTSWFRRRRFEGYTFYETLDENGKRITHNVYTGYWYIQELDRRGRITHRLVYIVLTLLCAALTLLGATRPIAANMRWPGGVPAFAVLFGVCWVLFGVVNEFIVPQKRTIGDYRASSLAVKNGALTSAIAGGVLVLVTLGYAAATHRDVGTHLLCAGAELLAGCAALVVNRMETKVSYTQELSDQAGKYTM